MASVNKVILVGHLGKDPEMKYMPNGDAVANVSIATSQKWKDKATGEDREETEWTRLVFFRRTAEVAGEYLKKGAQIYVEGRLKTKKWQDKEGHDRYMTEVIVDDLKMLGRPAGERTESRREPEQRERAAAPAGAGAASGGAAKKVGRFDDLEDDIPFIRCDLASDVIDRNLRRHAE